VYVDSHGGFCNAFTEGEHTNYVFGVNSDHLSGAFDRFAHCFIAPRLAASSSARELRAIESEFRLAEMSDSARSQEVMCCCATDGHFFKKFSWGNLRSLKEDPEARGVDCGAQLRLFYETHYTPDNMSLVVTSPRSIEDMLQMVEDSFGAWSRRHAAAPAPPPPGEIPGKGEGEAWSGHPFLGRVPVLTRFQSVENTHRLEMHWPLPPGPAAERHRDKADRYVAHLLGHEGRGSVLSALKARGYATDVYAGVGAVLCCAVMCCAVLCCDVLCCDVMCCTVLCCAVLCCTV
jgi:secreted Zn-dependent insulinase-like peptidase